MQSNIERKTTPEDWRYREAATFAFGSILEGPSSEKLVPIVNQGLPFFLNALKDPNSQVRHTTAWTIGKAYLTPKECFDGEQIIGENGMRLQVNMIRVCPTLSAADSG